MEEQRKKFGMELLPSLKKRLKAAANEQNRPLWSLTQEAVQRYLGESTPQTGVSATPEIQVLPKLEEGVRLMLRSIETLKQSAAVFRDALSGQAAAIAADTDRLAEEAAAVLRRERKSRGRLKTVQKREGHAD